MHKCGGGEQHSCTSSTFYIAMHTEWFSHHSRSFRTERTMTNFENRMQLNQTQKIIEMFCKSTAVVTITVAVVTRRVAVVTMAVARPVAAVTRPVVVVTRQCSCSSCQAGCSSCNSSCSSCNSSCSSCKASCSSCKASCSSCKASFNSLLKSTRFLNLFGKNVQNQWLHHGLVVLLWSSLEEIIRAIIVYSLIWIEIL